MASWMVHLQVADKLLERFPSLAPDEFIMGNIAPDSGVPTADGSTYIPSKDVSHFKVCGADGVFSVSPDAFAKKYLSNDDHMYCDRKARSFYLGYFSHLLTDVLWSKNILTPCKRLHADERSSDPSGFIKRLKADWYDLDFLYLREHPDFRGFKIYRSLAGFDNTYIDIFSRSAFSERHSFIVEFYSQPHGELDREYPYLNKETAEAFVCEAVNDIAASVSQYIPMI